MKFQKIVKKLKLFGRDSLPSNSLNNEINDQINENVLKFIDSKKNIKIPQMHRKGFQNKVEVVIPCYNHGEFLADAIKSIENQTNKTRLTITLINDNSTDNSLDVMKSIKKKYSSDRLNFKIINNCANLLQAGSINKAVKLSDNLLFIMLNADDLLTPDCLDLIIKTYEQRDDIFLLGGSSIWFDSTGDLPSHEIKKHNELKLTLFGPDDAVSFDNLNSINMSQSSCSFFKEAWELAGGYLPIEERVCSFDDRDFQMRVCALMPIGIYKDYPMEFYRTDSSQQRATI